ncbi:MAG: cyclic nucleotide-binding domain-containing protein [Candidatus Eisenbacteria bacterium]
MGSMVPVLERVELFEGMAPEHLRTLAECATDASYAPGEFVSRAGDEADAFWLIRSGRVVLEIFLPGRGEVTLANMSEGDIVGFSWLLPPYRMRFDILAVTATETVRFDGRVLRLKCREDAEFGFQLMSRFARIVADRVEAMNMQLLDIYGHHPIESE